MEIHYNSVYLNKWDYKLYMVINMSVLSIAPVGRIIKNAGADRISDDAKKALADYLEEYGDEISTQAVILVKHAKRKTVLGSDIELAVGMIE